MKKISGEMAAFILVKSQDRRDYRVEGYSYTPEGTFFARKEDKVEKLISPRIITNVISPIEHSHRFSLM